MPASNEIWGFGDFKDIDDGLWATMLILDGKPEETYKEAENGDQLGSAYYYYYYFSPLCQFSTLLYSTPRVENQLYFFREAYVGRLRHGPTASLLRFECAKRHGVGSGAWCWCWG